jgi:hypothetical protein
MSLSPTALYLQAIHWYSNDPSLWYVGFNKIQNIQVNYAKIAFLVGAAPGQDPKYLGSGGQSFAGVAPDGIAVNTALSESYITGLAVRGTEKGL